MFAKALIDRTLLVFYQWQKSNCRIVIWFISFLTFFASAAQQMSLWRGICYDTVSVKLILINFKVHVFIWWLPGETLNWGWLGLFFCWLNIVVWKQRSRSDEQAPPVLPNTVLFLKKSHSVPWPAENTRLIGQNDHRWLVLPGSCLASYEARCSVLSKTGEFPGALANLPSTFPRPCGVSLFSFSKQLLSVWYFIHRAPYESRDDAGW